MNLIEKPARRAGSLASAPTCEIALRPTAARSEGLRCKQAAIAPCRQKLAHVDRQTEKGPLRVGAFEPAYGEAAETVDGLGDAEDVLDDFFSQGHEHALVVPALSRHLPLEGF